MDELENGHGLLDMVFVVIYIYTYITTVVPLEIYKQDNIVSLRSIRSLHHVPCRVVSVQTTPNLGPWNCGCKNGLERTSNM